jgi:AcrR family transcriptional regulator
MTSRKSKAGRLNRDAEGDDEALFIARSDAPTEVRAEILKAAALAFMERGYAATSIDDVADTLGATKGRIYHYYRSKTDIFIDIHLESLRVLLERVRPIAARKDLKPHERLFAMCREHAITMMTTVAYYKSTIVGLNRFLLSITAPYQDEAMLRVLQQRAEYEDLLAEVIAEGSAEGIFVEIDPHFATKPMLGTLNWLNIWYESPPANGASNVEEVANALAAFCVKSLMKRPTTT